MQASYPASAENGQQKTHNYKTVDVVAGQTGYFPTSIDGSHTAPVNLSMFALTYPELVSLKSQRYMPSYTLEHVELGL